MSSPEIAQLRAQWALNNNQLESLLAQGVLRPFSVYYLLLLTTPGFLSLLVSHRSRPYVRYVRLLSFLWTTLVGVWIMKNCRTSKLGNGYIIGLCIVVIIFRYGTVLVLRDPEREFRRLERKNAVPIQGPNAPHGHLCDVLVWQAYPDSLFHRVSWVLGLFHPRGSCWNWRVAGSTPIPAPLLKQLNESPAEPVNMLLQWTVRRKLVVALLETVEYYGYILMLVSFMDQDPFNWGSTLSDWHISILSQTWHFPASSVPALTGRAWLAFGLMRVYGQFLYSLATACLLTISWLFPQTSHFLIRAPVNEPWNSPPIFGPYGSVLDHGLIGFWGSFWHQALRHDFVSWTSAIVSRLPAGIRKHAEARRIFYAIIPFTMSAVLHGCASYTVFSDSSSAARPMSFFFIQMLACIAQRVWTVLVFQKLRLGNLVPATACKAANLLTTWLFTILGTLNFGADLAAGGVYTTFFITSVF